MSLVFGIDTVGVSFPISDYDPTGATVTVVDYGGTDSDGADVRQFGKVTARRRLPSGGFVAFGIGRSAWLEASLPKAAHGHNVHAIPAAEAVEVFRRLHSEALEFCDPCVRVDDDGCVVDGSDPLQASLRRVDVVRDFLDVPVRPMLDALQFAPRRPNVLIRRYCDPDAGGAETLRVGVRSAWSCVLYDKHAETRANASAVVAPEGALRFEARLRSKFLGSARAARLGCEMREVGDLQDGRLAALGVDRFSHVGFGRAVNARSVLADKIASLGLSPSDELSFVGFLFAPAAGVTLRLSPNTLAKYRRLADSVGIVPGDVEGLETLARLDLATGRVLSDVRESGPRHGDK